MVFVNTSQLLVKILLQKYLYQINLTKSFFLAPASPDEIYTMIMSLKSKTSSGPDEINSILLKNVAKTLSKPLSNLINKSLTEGHVPKILKTAKSYSSF